MSLESKCFNCYFIFNEEVEEEYFACSFVQVRSVKYEIKH